VQQRRQLVEEWASMSQDARDSYQERATVRSSEGWFPPELASTEQNIQYSSFCNLIVPEPISPRNWAIWTKIRLLLHHFDDQEGTLFGQDDAGTAIIRPNPAGPNPVTVDGFNTWSFVEPAVFEHMAMTSTGTVVFHEWDSGVLLADQEALDTGRLLLCEFSNNGRLRESARTWPLYTEDVYNMIIGLGHPARRVIAENGWIGDEVAQEP
jgi:hypothetical protein